MFDSIFVVIMCGIIVVALIFLLFVIIYNKFQNGIIAVEEAEASIDSELRKRFDLLRKSIKVIDSLIDHEKEVLQGVAKLRSKKLNNIDLDSELNKSVDEFFALVEDNPELRSSDNFLKLQDSIFEVEEQLSGCRKFYNHKVSLYNKLVKGFPSLIIAKLFGYSEKPYFGEDKEEKNSQN